MDYQWLHSPLHNHDSQITKCNSQSAMPSRSVNHVHIHKSDQFISVCVFDQLHFRVNERLSVITSQKSYNNIYMYYFDEFGLASHRLIDCFTIVNSFIDRLLYV